jgi:hypothetical protein
MDFMMILVKMITCLLDIMKVLAACATINDVFRVIGNHEAIFFYINETGERYVLDHSDHDLFLFIYGALFLPSVSITRANPRHVPNRAFM